MNEFGIIRKYFEPLTMGRGDLRDDAAILEIPPGHELVFTSDTLNAGTHFFADMGPGDIARKALRVNLSDLAAMGAAPLSYQLCIAFPEKPSEDWLADFTGALWEDQKAYGIFCSGGDTTSIEGPLSISITALGLVPVGQAVRRSGAKAGDLVVLTGPVGDAWIGLKLMQEKGIPLPEGEGSRSYFLTRYTTPQPRTALAEAVRAHARAAIDVSDGFLADLAHVCEASGAGALVTLGDMLFSPQAWGLIEQGKADPLDLLAGGDDYELILAVLPERFEDFKKEAPGSRAVGVFTEGPPRVTLQDSAGRPVDFARAGWRHF